MEKLEINLTGDQKNLEIRIGAALPLKEPKIVSISGDINTIKTYLDKRKGEAGHSSQGVFKDRSIIYTDLFNRKITVDVDPENPYGAKIVGELLFTQELVDFCINTTTQFNRERLIKLLRFSKRFFKSPEVHLNILTAYQTFTAKATTQHENASTTRGDKTVFFDKKVSSSLPENFVLSMRIFKGQPVEDFMVEICLELTDAGAHFWFESPELEELIAIRTEEIFNEQLKEFSDDLIIVNV